MSVLGFVSSLPATALGLLHPHSKAAQAAAASTALRTGAKPAAAATTGTTTSGTTDIGSTFLNLLVKELQNQDPTAPMDSTAMVGQMISLNQLDQLIAINQSLTPTTTAAVTRYSRAEAQPSSAQAVADRSALLAIAPASSATQPFSTDATLNAAAASVSNTGALNLSNFNSLFGAK